MALDTKIIDRQKNRVHYLDFLRIFSVFAMMLLHVSASKWHTTPIDSFSWQVFNIYDSLVRFCVPIFIMISGALFLDNTYKVDIKKIYSHNIFRIITAFIFWSLAYALVTQLARIIVKNQEFSYITFFKNFALGHYHMWFLYLIIGIYITLPILKKIAEDKLICKYFLFLSFFFCFFLNFITNFDSSIKNPIELISNKANIQLILGYSGYFLLGHYLASTDISRKKRFFIYAAGIMSLIFTIIATNITSTMSGKADSKWYKYLLVTTYFTSSAVFCFFKYYISNIQWTSNSISIAKQLSSLTFGMYLVHDFINLLLMYLNITTLSYNPILSVPLHTILVFMLSLIIILFLKKIPKINKYII